MEQNNEYAKKPITVKEFKKENPQLKGKRIILCDHLKDKSMPFISVNLWIGDGSRMLLCAICSKVHSRTVWDSLVSSVLFMMDVSKQSQYQEWLEKAGK